MVGFPLPSLMIVDYQRVKIPGMDRGFYLGSLANMEMGWQNEREAITGIMIPSGKLT